MTSSTSDTLPLSIILSYAAPEYTPETPTEIVLSPTSVWGDAAVVCFVMFGAAMGAIVMGGTIVSVLLLQNPNPLPATVAAIVFLIALVLLIAYHLRDLRRMLRFKNAPVKISVTPLELVLSNPRQCRNDPECLPRDEIESVFVTRGVPRIGPNQEYEIRIWSRRAGLTRLNVSSLNLGGAAALERQLRRMILPTSHREGSDTNA